MPTKTPPDNNKAPMQILQAQRIKVLEAQNAELQQQVARLQARLEALQRPAATLPPRGRRPVYTADLLREVWIAHAGGEPLDSIATRLQADLKMMRIFVKGEYWTEAAKAVYAQFGAGRTAAKPAVSTDDAPQTV